VSGQLHTPATYPWAQSLPYPEPTRRQTERERESSYCC